MSDVQTNILNKVKNIPQIKSDTFRIIQALSDKNYSIAEIAKIVETDISLTARCLKTVNSASLGFRQKIMSIRHALSLLGSKNFLNIVLRESVSDISAGSINGYYAKKEDFWNDCLRSAIATRVLASKTSLPIRPDLAYTAALLQDIGKIVIDEFFDQADFDMENYINPDNSDDFIEVEKSLLGTDHTIIGEQLAEKWQFPDPLKAVIRYHHSPGEAPRKHRELTTAVHFATVLATFTDTIETVGNFSIRLDPIVDEYFKYDKQLIAKLICSIDLEYLATLRNFGWY